MRHGLAFDGGPNFRDSVITALFGLGIALSDRIEIVLLPRQVRADSVHLKPNVTADQIQTSLLSITFSTKGKGLKSLTRTLSVTLSRQDGLSNSFSQAIHVRQRT